MLIGKVIRERKKKKVYDLYYRSNDRPESIEEASKILRMSPTEILLYKISIMDEMLLQKSEHNE